MHGVGVAPFVQHCSNYGGPAVKLVINRKWKAFGCCSVQTEIRLDMDTRKQAKRVNV